MGLSTGPRHVFTQQWQTVLSSIPVMFFPATIRVYIPGAGREYDLATDTWIANPDTDLYTGQARLQPLRSARDAKNPGDDTSVQAVRLQVALNAIPALETNHRVQVVLCPTNRDLENYIYVVNEIVDSSNPIEQTFEATVNNESEQPLP